MVSRYDVQGLRNYKKIHQRNRRTGGKWHEVLMRDNFQCTVCANSHNLIIHHRDENNQNNKLSNLQTLCRGCHSRHHNAQREYPLHEKCRKGLHFLSGDNAQSNGMNVKKPRRTCRLCMNERKRKWRKLKMEKTNVSSLYSNDDCS